MNKHKRQIVKVYILFSILSALCLVVGGIFGWWFHDDRIYSKECVRYTDTAKTLGWYEGYNFCKAARTN